MTELSRLIPTLKNVALVNDREAVSQGGPEPLLNRLGLHKRAAHVEAPENPGADARSKEKKEYAPNGIKQSVREDGATG